MFSLDSIIEPAVGAGVGQAYNYPPEWHQGAEGYGKRFGSALAQCAIANTSRFGFAAVDGEDPRYFLSANRGFWPRMKHAAVSAMVSRTASGRQIPAFSRFVGDYGSAFISNAWYPDSRATAGDAAIRGTTMLAASLGFNVLREFLPHFLRHDTK